MRYKLTVRFSGKLLNTHEFDKGKINIGRSGECDVVIDNLGVSRIHAQIERTGSVFVLKDLKSNNGTFVRGERIQRYNLNHKDEFYLGKHSITFLYADPEEEMLSTESMPQKEEAISDIQGMTMSMDAQDIAIMGVKKHTTLAAYLSIVSVSGIRQQIPIKKTTMFFGTHPKCDYQVNGWFISKRHVLLLREATGFKLIHLGNKKPPKINGIEIDEQKLKHGDIIDVENIRMTFNIGTP